MSSEFTASIAEFGALAKQGAHPSASTGERTANKLAKALHAIGDDIMLLDLEALEGFFHLARLARGPFFTDHEKSLVYDTIAKSAGQS